MKDLARALPEAKRINRGKSSISDLAEKAYSLGASRVVIVDQIKGNPSRLRFLNTSSRPPQWEKSVLLGGVALHREITRKRFPSVDSSIVAFSDESLALLAEALSRGFSLPIAEEARSLSDEELLAHDSILFLYIRGQKRAASFFLPDTGEEVGPRLYLRGIHEV